MLRPTAVGGIVLMLATVDCNENVFFFGVSMVTTCNTNDRRSNCTYREYTERPTTDK